MTVAHIHVVSINLFQNGNVSDSKQQAALFRPYLQKIKATSLFTDIARVIVFYLNKRVLLSKKFEG